MVMVNKITRDTMKVLQGLGQFKQMTSNYLTNNMPGSAADTLYVVCMVTNGFPPPLDVG